MLEAWFRNSARGAIRAIRHQIHKVVINRADPDPYQDPCSDPDPDPDPDQHKGQEDQRAGTYDELQEGMHRYPPGGKAGFSHPSAAEEQEEGDVTEVQAEVDVAEVQKERDAAAVGQVEGEAAEVQGEVEDDALQTERDGEAAVARFVLSYDRNKWADLTVELLDRGLEASGWGAGLWCFNTSCRNLSGPSELQLKTFACGGGCGVRCCSRECQVQGWRDGHKLICGRLSGHKREMNGAGNGG